MNSSCETENENATQRASDARLSAVRQPWYSWQAPFLHTAIVVLVTCAFFTPSFVTREVWWRVGWVVAVSILLMVNQYLRERAWRKLVEFEAPALHRKLKMIAPNSECSASQRPTLDSG